MRAFVLACALMTCAAHDAAAQQRGPLYASFLPSESPSPQQQAPITLTSSAMMAAVMADAAQQPQQAQKPPLPVHTGLSALLHDTIADYVAFPQRISTWALLGIGGAGALAIHPADHAINHRLTGNKAATRIFAPGKYLGGWVQVGAGLGSYVVGRYVLPASQDGKPRSNKLSHIGFDLIRAQIVTQTITYGIKYAAQRNRPTGECCSFPSGHAATTFATAAVLERHFGLRLAWPTVLIASYVGASRLHDNRHFASDVVFGAALGTATGWTIVGRHGKENYAWIPVKTKGGVALMVVKQR